MSIMYMLCLYCTIKYVSKTSPMYIGFCLKADEVISLCFSKIFCGTVSDTGLTGFSVLTEAALPVSSETQLSAAISVILNALFASSAAFGGSFMPKVGFTSDCSLNFLLFSYSPKTLSGISADLTCILFCPSLPAPDCGRSGT